jgi:hypothetical protein
MVWKDLFAYGGTEYAELSRNHFSSTAPNPPALFILSSPFAPHQINLNVNTIKLANHGSANRSRFLGLSYAYPIYPIAQLLNCSTGVTGANSTKLAVNNIA